MLLRRSIGGTFARWTTQPQRSGLTHTGGVLARQKSVLPATSLTVQPLVDRSFIRVHGADSGTFLQGLMTNDIRHFAHCEAIYAMFLKANGRVFCDTLIYKQPGKEVADDFLLECDSSVAPQLEKHLRMYRLKKRVQVTSDESFRLWVAFRNGAEDEEGTTSEETTVAATGGQLQLFKDPRLARLGYRVLSSKSDQPADTMEQLHHMFPGATMASADGGPLPYTPFRYSLGVGEGTENLPDGKCFPLECNCDYLHGVSFHKGCYIGQELTARTYHTGVIRKRLMPLEFDAPPTLNVPPETLRDAEIKNADGAVVGKLRGLAGSFGLALLRIEKVPPGGELSLNVAGVSDHIVCRTRKPFWWPKETNTRH